MALPARADALLAPETSQAPEGLPVELVFDAATEATRPGNPNLVIPPLFVELGGALLFAQDDGIHGTELWRTDGTALGTYRLTDLCPGRCDGVLFGGLRPAEAAGGLLFFAGDDGVHELELWATDGTAAGTRLLRDIVPGRASSTIATLVAAGAQVAFLANDEVHGREIWMSDGTPAGTRLVFDSVAGPEDGNLVPYAYCNVLYAAGSSGLWRLDGTPAGGVQLASAEVSPFASLENEHLAFLPDCRLVFSAAVANDWEPWVSDGTPTGTFPIADLDPAQSSGPRSFVPWGSEVLFLADGPTGPPGVLSIFTTDGSPGGVTEWLPPAGFEPSQFPGARAVVGDKLFLAVFEASLGVELGVWDGTTLTVPLDIAPGPADGLATFRSQGLSLSGSWFVALDDSLLFPAQDPDQGLELWRSDGTPAGTYRLTEIGPGPLSASFDNLSQIRRPVTLGDRVFFRTWDPLSGHRLWTSDGTALGTGAIADLNSQTPAFFARRSQFPIFETLGSACVVSTRHRVLFETEVASRSVRRIYGTDGSPASVELLSETMTEESFLPDASCAPLNDDVKFFGSDGTDHRLFRSDGTSDGTESLASVGPVEDGSRRVTSSPGFVRFGDRALGLVGSDLLVTDGTPGGTSVDSLDLEYSSVHAAGLTDGVLLGASELFLSDGTAAGTTALGPEPLSYPGHLEPCLGGALFFADTAALGRELWWSDGTAENTRLVADLVPGVAGSQSSDPGWEDSPAYRDIACLGSRAVFVADDGVHGAELWRTDGTEEGTSLLADLYFGSYPSRPRRLTRVDDRAFFAAETDLHGLELWATDGTPEGTRLVRDLVPGGESSVPQALTAYKNLLLFSAWTPQFGREAWRSDGTPEGTVRITDLAPGPASSSPDRFAVVGDRLFFAANDHLHGFELFTLVDPALAEIFRDGFESGGFARWSAAP